MGHIEAESQSPTAADALARLLTTHCAVIQDQKYTLALVADRFRIMQCAHRNMSILRRQWIHQILLQLLSEIKEIKMYNHLNRIDEKISKSPLTSRTM
jgi:hypothetical protein